MIELTYSSFALLIVLWSVVVSVPSYMIGYALAYHWYSGLLVIDERQEVGDIDPPTPDEERGWDLLTPEEKLERGGITVRGRGGKVVDIINPEWRY